MSALPPDPSAAAPASKPKQHSFGSVAPRQIGPLLSVSPLPNPTIKLHTLLRNIWWTLRLFYRWQRPRWQTVKQLLQRGNSFLSGWFLWYWRNLKTKPDTRLATLGLVGGFAVPLLTVMLLLHYFPPSPPSLELAIDPAVPAPDLSQIEPEASEAVEATETSPSSLNPANFRFELFVRRDASGKIRLLHKVAEASIYRWFPNGTPAVTVMRFLGDALIRSGVNADNAADAAKSHCIALPINRVFRQNTIACTYGHRLPGPELPHENSKLRMFWIISLTNDAAGRLTDLRIHARMTEATP